MATKGNIKAIDFLRIPKLNAGKVESPRRRSKRPIYEYSESQVKILSLKFLGHRFHHQVKDSYNLGQAKFFEILSEYITAVRITKSKISFCGSLSENPLVSVNFEFVKNKYKEEIFKTLEEQEVDSSGLIKDKKIINSLMVLCQTNYIRCTNGERFRMTKTSDTTKATERGPSGPPQLDH